MAADPERHATVLRQALFGDVEAGHHLDAADQQRGQRPARLEHLAQDAVDPKAHDQAALLGLDVDVGGVLLDRLQQQRVDQPHHGRVVALVEQVVDERGAVGQRREIAVGGGRLGRLGGGVAVDLRERGVEGRVRQRLEEHAAVRRSAATSASAETDAPARCAQIVRSSSRRSSTPWRRAKP